jgi:hypothetical protein
MRALKLLTLAGILLAFFLRVYSLGDKNVWWDEGLAVWAARKALPETTLWTAGDVHPPLYFWLLWPWIRVAGEAEFPARYLTVIMAVLTVAAVFPLTRKLAGPTAGALAMWLLAVSPFHIWWSQEMRMYIPAALFFTLSAYFALKASSADSLRPWAGLILACSAALYTLYSAVFLIPVCAVLIVLKAFSQRKVLARLALALVAVALLWTPWLSLALPRMRSWSVAEKPPSLGFVLKLNAVLLSTGVSANLDQYLPAGIFIVTVAFAGLILFSLDGESRKVLPGALMLLAGVLLQPLAVWLLTQPRSLFYVPKVEARYFIPFAPFFYSLLALSLAAIGKRLRPLGLGLGVGTLALMVAFLPRYYEGRDWEDDLPFMVRLIQIYGHPDDAVILVSGDRFPEFLYYYDSPYGSLRLPVYPAPRLSSTLSYATVEEELGWIIGSHPRVWLAAVKPFLQDPEGVAAKWLSEKMKLALEFHFKRDSLYLFSHGEEPAAPSREIAPFFPSQAELAPGVRVLGYDLLDKQGKQGATVHLGLFLELEKPATFQFEAISPSGLPLLMDAFTLQPGYHYKFVGFRIAPSWGGRFRLRLRVDSQALYLGHVGVKRGAIALGEEEIKHRLSAKLGDRIKLMGYNLVGVSEPPVLHPGETLILELFWEAEAPTERSYTVFTHLLGPVLNPATGKPVWAQDDQEPMEGLYPTTHWLPNVLWKDRYELTLPSDAPPGDYLLEVGMYLRETGERLPVSGDGADPESRRIILGVIKVED